MVFKQLVFCFARLFCFICTLINFSAKKNSTPHIKAFPILNKCVHISLSFGITFLFPILKVKRLFNADIISMISLLL